MSLVSFISASHGILSNGAILSLQICHVILFRCLIYLLVRRFAVLSLCLLPPIGLFVPFDLLLQSYPTVWSLLFLVDLVCKQLSSDLTVLLLRSGCLTPHDYTRWNVLKLDSAGGFVLGRRYMLAGPRRQRRPLSS